MTIPSIVVSANATDQHRKFIAATDPRAEQLAQQTGLALVTPKQLKQTAFYLFWKDQHLTLCDQSTAHSVDICVDFCGGKSTHRQKYGGGYGQPLARAINAKPNAHQLVCDATGGMGQDAFVLATLGCQVVILERSKIIFALLKDGISRAQKDERACVIAQRMSGYNLDSKQLPDNWPLHYNPATVYLDPMYPHSGKKAAAKKGMQTLQRLLPIEQPPNTADGEESLLLAAIATASQRVIVKRPARALPLKGPLPVGSISSPNTRYDLYNAH